MIQRVITVPSTTSVREIAKIMARENVSGVAVSNLEYGILGIVSECDMLRHFGKRNWELLTAEEIMTPDIEVIMPETTLEQAANIMIKRNIHRLLVMGKDLIEPPMPVGIISAGDIIREIGMDSSL